MRAGGTSMGPGRGVERAGAWAAAAATDGPSSEAVPTPRRPPQGPHHRDGHTSASPAPSAWPWQAAQARAGASGCRSRLHARRPAPGQLCRRAYLRSPRNHARRRAAGLCAPPPCAPLGSASALVHGGEARTVDCATAPAHNARGTGTGGACAIVAREARRWAALFGVPARATTPAARARRSSRARYASSVQVSPQASQTHRRRVPSPPVPPPPQISAFRMSRCDETSLASTLLLPHDGHGMPARVASLMGSNGTAAAARIASRSCRTTADASWSTGMPASSAALSVPASSACRSDAPSALRSAATVAITRGP